MPKNKIEDLRNHLFLTLEKLQDGEIEIETARTIAEVSQAIVNTAKIEVQFLKEMGSNRHTGFIALNDKND